MKNSNEEDNTIRNFVIGAVVVLLLFALALYKNFTNPKERSNVETVHWHSPITYEICGEKKVIVEGQTHGLVHGHNDETVHVEGTLLVEKSVPLKDFFNATGIVFSSSQIGDYKNGDICPKASEPGKVSFYVNDEQNLEYENYIIRESDVLKIKFE